MVDRIFLRLGPKAALGADVLQWIVYVPRRDEPVPPDATLTSRDWRPIAYVASGKNILMRCIRENGLALMDTTRLELESYPNSFDEWRANGCASPRAANANLDETEARLRRAAGG